MRRTLLIASTVAALCSPLRAQAFVYDGGAALPTNKQDYASQSNVDPTKRYTATEINAAHAAENELRDALLLGARHGLQQQTTVPPAPDGGVVLYTMVEDGGALLLKGVWPDGVARAAGENPKVHNASTLPMRYCAPGGDDTLDGMTLATAKLHCMAAYDSLPAGGGEVDCYSGASCDAVAGRGFWFANDPAQGALPGWRGATGIKNVLFKGVGGTSAAFGRFGQAEVFCGGPRSPAIWMMGTEGGVKFENLKVHGARWYGVAVGPDGGPEGATAYGLTANIFEHNVSDDDVNLGYTGTAPQAPLWLGNAFNVDIEQFGVNQSYNCSAAVFPDAGPAHLPDGGSYCWVDTASGILIESGQDGGASFSPYDVSIRHGTINGSGMRLVEAITNTGAETGGQVQIEDLLTENSAVPAIVLDQMDGNGAGGFDLFARNINTADSNNIGVQVLNSTTMHKCRTLGVGYGDIKGPCRMLDAPGELQQTNSGSPEVQGQVGMFGDRGRLVGQVDNLRRSGAPVAFPYPNLAAPAIAPIDQGGGGYFAGTQTVVPGPDGIWNALRFQANLGGDARVIWHDADHSGGIVLAAGARVLGGFWALGAGTTNSGIGNLSLLPGFGQPYTITVSSPIDRNVAIDQTPTTSGSARFQFASREQWMVGQWRFESTFIRVDSGSMTTQVMLDGYAASGGESRFAYPFLYVVPASDGRSDDELMALFYASVSVPPNVPPGMVSLPVLSDFALQQHLHSKCSSAPTVAYSGNLGPDGGVAISGCDSEGDLSISGGFTTDAGALASITFAAPFADGGVPSVFLQGDGPNAAAFGPSIYPIETATGWTLQSTSPPASNATYKWHYWIVGH